MDNQILFGFFVVLGVGLLLGIPIWLYIVTRMMMWAALRSWAQFFSPNNHHKE